MTDEVHDLATIEGCITWSLLDKDRRAPVMAELVRLRAIELAALVVVADCLIYGTDPHERGECDEVRALRKALAGA